MPLEDVHFMKSNSDIDSKMIFIDSSKRRKQFYPFSNNYVVEFTEPFNNICGIEVLDAMLPSTMYNIEKFNNTFIYSTIHIKHYTTDIEESVKSDDEQLLNVISEFGILFNNFNDYKESNRIFIIEFSSFHFKKYNILKKKYENADFKKDNRVLLIHRVELKINTSKKDLDNLENSENEKIVKTSYGLFSIYSNDEIPNLENVKVIMLGDGESKDGYTGIVFFEHFYTSAKKYNQIYNSIELLENTALKYVIHRGIIDINVGNYNIYTIVLELNKQLLFEKDFTNWIVDDLFGAGLKIKDLINMDLITIDLITSFLLQSGLPTTMALIESRLKNKDLSVEDLSVEDLLVDDLLKKIIDDLLIILIDDLFKTDLFKSDLLTTLINDLLMAYLLKTDLLKTYLLLANLLTTDLLKTLIKTIIKTLNAYLLKTTNLVTTDLLATTLTTDLLTTIINDLLTTKSTTDLLTTDLLTTDLLTTYLINYLFKTLLGKNDFILDSDISFPDEISEIRIIPAEDSDDILKNNKIEFKIDSIDYRILINTSKCTMSDVLGLSISDVGGIGYKNDYKKIILDTDLYFYSLINDYKTYITSPGIINLNSNVRYTLLRCAEIETHIHNSFLVSGYCPGIGLFKHTGNNDQNNYRFDFTNFHKNPFHPIGKLSKLSISFELPSGGLYDFKGCDHILLISLKYYRPRDIKIQDRYSLNPSYNPDFISYIVDKNNNKNELNYNFNDDFDESDGNIVDYQEYLYNNKKENLNSSMVDTRVINNFLNEQDKFNYDEEYE